MKEVPLYNDVMLPSTGDQLTPPLSPLPLSETLRVTAVSSEDAKAKSYAPARSTSSAIHRSSKVRGSIGVIVRLRLYTFSYIYIYNIFHVL